MRGSRVGFAVTGALVVSMGAILFLQWQTGAELRNELELLRADHRELLRLQEENRRLAAAQVAPAELESLRADHATLEAVRADVQALQQRDEQMPVRIAAPVARMIPAREWKNAGRATPEAAVETALWAAAGGDLDVLAGTLAFDGAARVRAEALFNGLPDAARAQYASPEHLIALLLAKDVPPSSTMLVTGEPWSDDHPDLRSLHLRLQPVDGPVKNVSLIMQDHDDGWKVMVPASVVEKYGRALQGQTQADGPVAPAVPGG